jgi:hypothetical protein
MGMIFVLLEFQCQKGCSVQVEFVPRTLKYAMPTSVMSGMLLVQILLP